MESIKVYFAINIEQFENLIKDDLGSDAAVIGSATYQESVLSNLPKSGADVLILIDSLKGGMNLYDFIYQIRMSAPAVRIILLTNRKERNDPLLDYAVKLGIYDIIDGPSLSYKEITKLIRTPSTFEEACRFYIKDSEGKNLKELPQPSQEEKGKFKFLKRKKAEEHDSGYLLENSPEPVFDIKVLRETIYSEASKDVAARFEEQINSLTKQNTALEREIAKQKAALLSSEGKDSEKDREISELKRQNAESEKFIESLEERLKKTESDSEAFKESAFNELESLRAQITELNNINSSAAGISAFDSALEINCELTTDFSEELKILRTENSALKSDAKLLVKEINEAEKQLLAKEIQIDSANKKVKELKDCITKKDQQIKKLKKNSKEIGAQRPSDEASPSQSEISILSGRADSLLAENKELKSDYNKLAKEFGDLKEAYSRLELSKNSISKRLKKFHSVNKKLKAPRGKENQYKEILPEIIYPENFISEGVPAIYLFTGSRRGIGTTTLAINYAASLAKKGEKTILLELNSKLPFAANYFDMHNISFGIEEAVQNIRSKNYETAKSAVIKPAVMSTDKEHRSCYSKLPKDFHMMLYSESSIGKSLGTNLDLINSVELGILIDYLSDNLGYKNIVLDIGMDNQQLFSNALKCGRVNRFVMNMKREGISIVGARNIVDRISEAGQLSLVRSGRFIINEEGFSEYTNDEIALAIKAPKDSFVNLEIDASDIINAEKLGCPFAISEKGAGIYDKLTGLFS